jgi:hypothetical protein
MATGDVSPKMLCVPTTLGTTSTTLFTVPSSHQYAVKQIIICNTDGNERLVTLSYDGSASVAGNCFLYRLPIAQYDTVVLDTALVFEATDTLQGLSDTGSVVTVSVTGWDKEV